MWVLESCIVVLGQGVKERRSCLEDSSVFLVG